MIVPGDAFVLGINYWPRRKAMYWWQQFDAGEVREEFQIIRDLGLQVVRIFLLWDDFQPAPDRVSGEALAHLVKVADIAADLGLGLDVTFFTGHMSGPNWSPGWLLDAAHYPSPHRRQVVSGGRVVQSGYRNPFADQTALAAERLLIREVVSTLNDHPGVWMWNLGNEPDLFAWPADAAAGQRWVRELVELIHENDSRPVTCGLHFGSALEDNGLRIDKVHAVTDLAVMHSYPDYDLRFTSTFDPNFIPFTVAVTAGLCGKPVLMEEFGACTALRGEATQMWNWESLGKPRQQLMISEEDYADYLEKLLPNLVEVGALGAMIWCFADYHADLWDRPPCDESRQERQFGLVRADGSLKPHAQIIKKFAETRPVVKEIPPWAQLYIDPDAYYTDPVSQLRQLWAEYQGRLESVVGASPTSSAGQ